MLDFANLKTPPGHGDVLVAPDARTWLAAARANHAELAGTDRPLADSTLATWRRRTREKLAGSDDQLVIVLGHQPAFIHPGVWAKHVAAVRMARAAQGTAINLIVDSDVPKRPDIVVPSVIDGRVATGAVRFAEFRPGSAFEQIDRLVPERIEKLEADARGAIGAHFQDSQMPAFLDAFAGAADAKDWVDQAVAARRAVEAPMDVVLTEHRISGLWCNPLVVDILHHPAEFAAAYNRALAEYRRANGIRGNHRPMPDLMLSDDRCEVPMWVHHPEAPRRRLFVQRDGDMLRLFADDLEFGNLPITRVASCSDLEAAFNQMDKWQLRPRALTLTIWARLLLADLFIHGIGGAKYDRISDSIIADYYGLTPPAMACVSATLHLDLPGMTTVGKPIDQFRRELRDLEWNPQRHLSRDADLDRLIERRAEAVSAAAAIREADARNQTARRSAFREIRDLTSALHAARPEALPAKRADLLRAAQRDEEDRIARGREYFFGLFDSRRLEALTDALPGVRQFAG